MLDLVRSVTQPQGTLPLPTRILVLVDRITAHPRLFARLQQNFPHSHITLLWVVTPSAVLTWGALLAEPVEERTHAMLAALGERMEEAQRRLAPLQRAATAAGLRLRTTVVHGALAETLVRVARAEHIDHVLIPTGSDYPGQPLPELISQMRRRLPCPVETLD